MARDRCPKKVSEHARDIEERLIRRGGKGGFFPPILVGTVRDLTGG